MSTFYYATDGALLTAAAAIVGAAVGASTKRVITAAALINTTAAPIDATVYLVPAAGAVGAATCVISARTIAPKETYFCPELVNQGLNAGGSVQALGNGLTMRYAGRDITNG